MIYLDNSATTRIDESVVEAMLPWLRENYGNASSIYQLGRQARVAIEYAREEIASLIGAHPAELIFTSGGTESNNTVLKSCTAESNLCDEVLYSAIEHHAVIYPAKELSSQKIRTFPLSVDNQGILNLEEFAQKKTTKQTLVSVMHANNETGMIQPLEKIRAIAPDALIHTDAVQSFGKIPVNMYEFGVDFASFSAHKIHGPKGVGALFIRKGIDFKAHQQGGGQERNRRAGTESPALIVGFQVAARQAIREVASRTEAMKSAVALLRELLVQTIPSIRINTTLEHSLPNILNISFLDAEMIDGEAILQSLDIYGIAASNGSACVSGSLQPSHVLSAMGRSDAEAKAAVRFSVSKDTTELDVRRAANVLAEVMTALRQ
ncbi:MAG: cysteine desulfurase [Ignavibacteriae bacterium]|nr:cysteine desulfurase [Ignavibacteriota bacterium]